jgi:hypothetical protein
MTTHTLSHETRDALDNLKAYLSAGNEAVQYEFSYLADLVTQNPSVILGGIQAGGLPPDDIATDAAGEAFSVGPGAAGPFPASISLDHPVDDILDHRLRALRERPRRAAQRPVHVRDPAR